MLDTVPGTRKPSSSNSNSHFHKDFNFVAFFYYSSTCFSYDQIGEEGSHGLRKPRREAEIKEGPRSRSEVDQRSKHASPDFWPRTVSCVTLRSLRAFEGPLPWGLGLLDGFSGVMLEAGGRTRRTTTLSCAELVGRKRTGWDLPAADDTASCRSKTLVSPFTDFFLFLLGLFHFSPLSISKDPLLESLGYLIAMVVQGSHRLPLSPT